MLHRPSFLALLLCGLLSFGAPLAAAPFVPASDAQVLEVLPARASDPRMRELRGLRAAVAQNPRDLDTALRLAQRYYDEVAAEGDPRYIGYAQAALAPWWDEPDPPAPARVMRAILLQFNHHFEPALADLDAAVRQRPGDGTAWAWRAAIDMVQAHYERAREACGQLAANAAPLIGVACRAQVDATTGRAAEAVDALNAALRAAPQATPEELLWSLTRLAEIEERRGHAAPAEAAYRRALGLGLTDGYLLAAWADFLLDHGRPAEVITLLKDKTRSDLLLLRLAIAARQTGDAAQKTWADDLAARFDAARLRGDTVHQKEEARYALQLQGQPRRAVQLAAENYRVQREPADARILLEAALAARDPAAAAPALQWLAESRIESATLAGLARKLKALP